LSDPTGSRFLSLLELEPLIAATFHNSCALIEVFELLGELDRRTAFGAVDLKELALKAWECAVVVNLLPGKRH